VKIPLTFRAPIKFPNFMGKTYALPLARGTLMIFIVVYVFET